MKQINHFLITLFIALLLSLSIIIISSAPINTYIKYTNQNKIHFVGGSGPNNYTFIQDAINAANNQDIVFVFNGIYNENIIINKSIHLIGETKNKTIINGQYIDTILQVKSDTVSIQNITIKNAGGNKQNYGIKINTNNTLLNNLLIQTTRSGLCLNKSVNTTIINCTFYSNGDGILILSSQHVLIEGCCLHHNAIGIRIENSYNCVIYYCHAYTNGIACLLNSSSTITIINSNISDNSANLGGLFLINCDNVTVNQCILNHNGAGINIYSSDFVTVIHCELTRNTHFAISMRTASTMTIISFCEIRDNFRYGIYVEKKNQCILVNNNIVNNMLFGLSSINAQCTARYNWWGSPFGPSSTILQPVNKIMMLFGRIKSYPWHMKSVENCGTNLTYYHPCMVVSADKIFKLPGNDSDMDGVPDWWELTWGYDPLVWNDHHNLDPDNDALNNIEECYTNIYGSNPFFKDIFLEIDWMESSTSSNKPSEQLIHQVISLFQNHNITLHIDVGNLDGGEEIPYCSSIFSYTKLRDLYWEYFLHNNMTNPRKGIFHYGLICNYCPDLNFPFFGWDNLDSFAISIEWLKNKYPYLRKEHLSIGAIVHHLGHSLELLADTYDGIDNVGTQYPFSMQWWKYKNYKSCMNYFYKYKLFTYSDGTNGPGDFNDWEALNFHFFKNSDFTIKKKLLTISV
jgi:parallel beta-helix repeat protein